MRRSGNVRPPRYRWVSRLEIHLRCGRMFVEEDKFGSTTYIQIMPSCIYTRITEVGESGIESRRGKQFTRYQGGGLLGAGKDRVGLSAVGLT